MEGILHITFEGNRNACYVWWNDSEHKANLNWVNNFDNANDWFVFRYSLHFSPNIVLGEFCFVSCPLQSPSILPVSVSGFRQSDVLFSIRF